MYTILCFGDSNTYGAKATGGRFERNERWTGILQNLLGSNYYVIEEGCGGRTTVFDDPIEEYKNGKAYLIPCMHSHSPIDLIILMLGTNDLKSRFALSAMDVQWAIGNLIQCIKQSQCARGAKAPKLLVAAPIKMGKLTELADILQGAREKCRQLPRRLEALCNEQGVYYLNAGDYAQADDADGVHLSLSGHESLAKAFAAKIKQIQIEGE